LRHPGGSENLLRGHSLRRGRKRGQAGGLTLTGGARCSATMPPRQHARPRRALHRCPVSRPAARGAAAWQGGRIGGRPPGRACLGAAFPRVPRASPARPGRRRAGGGGRPAGRAREPKPEAWRSGRRPGRPRRPEARREEEASFTRAVRENAGAFSSLCACSRERTRVYLLQGAGRRAPASQRGAARRRQRPTVSITAASGSARGELVSGGPAGAARGPSVSKRRFPASHSADPARPSCVALVL
jgi:hypothetical protein